MERALFYVLTGKGRTGARSFTFPVFRTGGDTNGLLHPRFELLISTSGSRPGKTGSGFLEIRLGGPSIYARLLLGANAHSFALVIKTEHGCHVVA